MTFIPSESSTRTAYANYPGGYPLDDGDSFLVQRPQIRLQNVIVTLVLLFALVPLAAMAWIVFQHGRTILIQRTGEDLAQIAFDTAHRFGEPLYEDLRELAEMGAKQGPQLLDLARSSTRDVQGALEEWLRVEPEFLSLSLLDASGLLLVEAGADLTGEATRTVMSMPAQDRLYIGKVRQDPGEEKPVLPLAVAFSGGGAATTPAGYLVAALDWSVAYDTIDSVELFRKGQGRRAYLTIVDSEGFVLAGPKFLRESGAVLSRRIQDFDPRYGEILQRAEARGYTLVQREWNEWMLVAYARFPSATSFLDPQWRAIAFLDTERPFVGWDEFARKMLLFVVPVGGGITAGALVLSRRITKPLRELEGVVGQVTQGNLAVRAASASKTELGALARAFNQMVDSLAHYREQAEEMTRMLEARVAERTQELRSAYEELVGNQERLVQSEKMAAIGQMVAAVAHELRTPLGVLSSAAEALLEAAGRDAAARPWAEMMVSEVSRLNRVITEFLEFARPERGFVSGVPWPLEALLDGALEPFRGEIQERGLLVSQHHEDVPPIPCNPSMLTQAFGNLVRNALDAMQDGGRLSLGLSRRGDVAVVTVADTGKGIDAGIAAKVFDPFFSTKDLGTGLGLSIVKKAAETHGGEVRFHPNEGGGVVFELHLPFEPPPDPPVPAATDEA